ncbi:Cystathionine gamma-synthase Rhodoplastic CGS1 [Gracilaria domingensis]|nr:Cystathionine gamma-synthase Rhodoplastic CGS1 [Gracilaria domingensis]
MGGSPRARARRGGEGATAVGARARAATRCHAARRRASRANNRCAHMAENGAHRRAAPASCAPPALPPPARTPQHAARLFLPRRHPGAERPRLDARHAAPVRSPRRGAFAAALSRHAQRVHQACRKAVAVAVAVVRRRWRRRHRRIVRVRPACAPPARPPRSRLPRLGRLPPAPHRACKRSRANPFCARRRAHARRQENKGHFGCRADAYCAVGHLHLSFYARLHRLQPRNVRVL